MHKYVYLFSEGNGSMRELLGGKGANLAEMTNLGMPVPQGFTISTEACTKYYEDDRNINDEIKAQVYEALARIEKINGKKFGDAKNPLLVSVRSGARASMPGMMDTILNLGLNDEVAAGLIAGNPTPAFTRFVYDSYRRFIQMFSDVVMELSKKTFEVIIDEVKAAKGVKNDIDLDADDMKKLVDLFKAHYKEEKGEDWQKAPIEKNHEYIRYVIPKGKSLDPYTQEDFTILANHINNTKRLQYNGKAPIELAASDEFRELFRVTGIQPIPADDVMLKPRLLKP